MEGTYSSSDHPPRTRYSQLNGRDHPNMRSNPIGQTYPSSKPDWTTSPKMTCFHELVLTDTSQIRRPPSINLKVSRAVQTLRFLFGKTEQHHSLHFNLNLSETQKKRLLSFQSCSDVMAGSRRARNSVIVLAIVTLGESSTRIQC